MIPYSGEPHPTSGLTNAQLGTWLFVAIQTMLSASLISSHVLLSAGAQRRPDVLAELVTASTWISSLLLVVSWAALRHADAARSHLTRARLVTSAVCALAFVLWRGVDVRQAMAAGALPSTHVLIGSGFVLVGLQIVYVMCGAVAVAWLAIGETHPIDLDRTRLRRRLDGLRIYWGFVVVLWFAILITVKTSQ